jgi:hypothetical protein
LMLTPARSERTSAMRTTLRRPNLFFCTLVILAATATSSRAGYISGGGGLEGLGTFAGHADYVAADSGHATLTIDLWNTSPAANGGFITALVFNNPFGLLGGPGFSGGIAAPPFGNFDIGASVTDQFLGGGSPVGGIGVGESSTFAFAFTGSGLDGLTLENFIGPPPAPQDGHPGPVTLLARFRGFNNGGSDKVPGGLEDIGPPPGSGLPSAPEPATLVLAGIATISGLGCGWRTRRRGQRV